MEGAVICVSAILYDYAVGGYDRDTATKTDTLQSITPHSGVGYLKL